MDGCTAGYSAYGYFNDIGSLSLLHISDISSPNNIWGQDVWVQSGSLGRHRLQEPTRPMHCNEIPRWSGYLNIYVYRSIINELLVNGKHYYYLDQ